MYRNTYLEINIDNLKNNVKNITQYYNNYEYYFGIVKANCYGHGVKEVLNELIESGINYLAVSSLEEAIECREINKDISILCLEPIKIEYLNICIEKNITITLHDYFYAKKIIDTIKMSKKLKIHIKIDSGMNRIGFKNKDEVYEIYKQLKNNKNLEVEGIYTHFATSGICDKEWDNQLNNFIKITSKINLNEIKIRHLYKSASFINHKKLDFANGIRLGISMYGYYTETDLLKNRFNKIKRYFIKKNISSVNTELPFKLKPAFKMISEIIQVKKVKKGEYVGYNMGYRAKKDEYIGIICTGYDDGVLRSNKNRLVSINNKKYNLIGDIGMGMCAVLVDENVKMNDKVILIGDEIDINYVAEYNKTSIYEILCNSGKILERKYLKKHKKSRKNNQ